MELFDGLRPRPVGRCRTSARSARACSRTGRWRCAGRRERQRRSSAAFEAYHAIYRDSGDSFPGINAATLALLAGDEARARRAGRGPARRSGGRRGRRLLYGGDQGRGAADPRPHRRGRRGAGRRRGPRQPAIYGARSSTARQLAMVAAPSRAWTRRRARRCSRRWRRRGSSISAAICSPPMPAAEARLRAEVDAAARRGGGRLRLWRARLRRRPPVRRGGARRAASSSTSCCRSRRRISSPSRCGRAARAGRRAIAPAASAAASVTFASQMDYFGDPAQYGYGSRMAMGLARLRAAASRRRGGPDRDLGRRAVGRAGRHRRRRRRLDERRAGAAAIVDPGAVDRGLVRPAAARAQRP